MGRQGVSYEQQQVLWRRGSCGRLGGQLSGRQGSKHLQAPAVLASTERVSVIGSANRATHSRLARAQQPLQKRRPRLRARLAQPRRQVGEQPSHNILASVAAVALKSGLCRLRRGGRSLRPRTATRLFPLLLRAGGWLMSRRFRASHTAGQDCKLSCLSLGPLIKRAWSHCRQTP